MTPDWAPEFAAGLTNGLGTGTTTGFPMAGLFALSSIYWDFPILLLVFSLVYSATRHDSWPKILRETIYWLGRIGGFLVGVGLILFVLSSLL